MPQSFGLIGVGAFGALAARHLAPHFDLLMHDSSVDFSPLAIEIGAKNSELSTAASCDIVMLAVPVQKLRHVLSEIAPLLKPDASLCSMLRLSKLNPLP